MELSSDDPFPSSPRDQSQDLGDLPDLPPLPMSPTPLGMNRPARGPALHLDVDLSSDPIGHETSFRSFPISGAPQSRPLKRRHISPTDLIDKTPTATANSPLNPPTQDESLELVLQARDLILRACTISQPRDKQARLLDLLEIFREYTEQGRIRHTSTILASQVANLEQATRRIENQARQQPQAKHQPQAKQQPQQPQQPQVKQNWAQVAQNTARNTTQDADGWKLVGNRKANQANQADKGSGAGTMAGNASSSPKDKSGTGKKAPSGRCTLLQAHLVQAPSFSSFRIEF